MSLIVGITGAAGSGKDTAAQALATLGSFRLLSFAMPIKAMISTAFGFSAENWEDRDWKESTIEEIGRSPRQMAQTLGTEWGRELIHQDIWVIATANAIHQVHSKNPHINFVIPDVRFENEARWIMNQGGVIIEITREGILQVERHSSEDGIPLGLIDFIINNNHDIEYLQNTTRAYVLGQLAKQYEVPTDDVGTADAGS